jgi:hypothetical protein
VSDPRDARIARWIKTGLARRSPSATVRGRILKRAASRQFQRERRSAVFQPRYPGRHLGKTFDPWSLGLAAQTALDWFPDGLPTFRAAF